MTMIVNFLRNLWTAYNTGSVVSDIRDKVVAIYGAFSVFRKLFNQILKTGESILSKIATSGLSVSCLTGAGFFVLLQSAVSKLLASLRDIDNALNVSGSSVSQTLDKVNYFFPLDTLASLILLYVAVWIGVATFRFWCRLFSLVLGYKQAHAKE